MTKFGIPFLAASLLTGIGSIATVPAFPQSLSPAADAGVARSEPGSRMIKPIPFGERVEDRSAFIKAALKITPAQEAQWTILAAAMRENAEALDRATVLARQQPLPADSARLAAIREVFDKSKMRTRR